MTTILYSNVNIIDIDKFESYETNLLVEDGVVADIGCNKICDKNINVIDCSNLFMLPGFVDSHGHMTHLGKNQYEVDLRDCKSEFEVVKKIKNFLELNSNLFWINGGGWNQETFETKSLPDNEYLSINFPDIPIILSRIVSILNILCDLAFALKSFFNHRQSQPTHRHHFSIIIFDLNIPNLNFSSQFDWHGFPMNPPILG